MLDPALKGNTMQKGMKSKLYPIRIIVTVNIVCDMSLILYEILGRKATM